MAENPGSATASSGSVPANTPVTPPAVDTPTETARPRKFKIDDRYIAPVFITLILLFGDVAFGFLESWAWTVAAIVSGIATELVLARLFTGKWPHLASAYITGISVGILIRSTTLWPYVLCSAIAITSKYVIRVSGRHIWNPSNFAIAIMIMLAHSSVATLSFQLGNAIWAVIVIWVLGSIIIYRLKRFHICLTYVVSFVALAFLRSAVTGDHWQAEIAPLTGPMYQLFVFFMITDPKTTVKSKKGQILVAFLIAVAEALIRLSDQVWSGNIFSPHAPYFALFTVGPIANLVEIGLTSRKKVAPSTPAPGGG